MVPHKKKAQACGLVYLKIALNFTKRSFDVQRTSHKPSIDVVPIVAAACILHLAACNRCYGHLAREATHNMYTNSRDG